VPEESVENGYVTDRRCCLLDLAQLLHYNISVVALSSQCFGEPVIHEPSPSPARPCASVADRVIIAVAIIGIRANRRKRGDLCRFVDCGVVGAELIAMRQ